jgi:hypothetical protein
MVVVLPLNERGYRLHEVEAPRVGWLGRCVMDTTTLVVGQNVHVGSYSQYFVGKVVRVTSDGVEVQGRRGLMRFDIEGNGCDGNERFRCFAIDTTKLVVGQEVFLKSECYCCEGIVVEVTPEEGVVVRATLQSNITMIGNLLHFDKEGKGRDDEGTYECGAWYIADIGTVRALLVAERLV